MKRSRIVIALAWLAILFSCFGIVTILSKGKPRVSLNENPATLPINGIDHGNGIDMSHGTSVINPVPDAQTIESSERSPFTDVLWSGDEPIVQFDYNSSWYQLDDLNGIDTSQLITLCKAAFKTKWKTGFEEHLILVLVQNGYEVGMFASARGHEKEHPEKILSFNVSVNRGKLNNILGKKDNLVATQLRKSLDDRANR